MQVDFAFLLTNAIKACTEVKTVSLTDTEQKLDDPVLVLKFRILLLFELLSQFKQLVVSDQDIDAQIQLCKLIFSGLLSVLFKKLCHHFFSP